MPVLRMGISTFYQTGNETHGRIRVFLLYCSSGAARANLEMSLSVLVKSASSLPNVERFSKSDPLTVCTLQGS